MVIDKSSFNLPQGLSGLVCLLLLEFSVCQDLFIITRVLSVSGLVYY